MLPWHFGVAFALMLLLTVVIWMGMALAGPRVLGHWWGSCSPPLGTWALYA